MIIDFWYIVLIVPTMILGFYAQHRVMSTYRRNAEVRSRGRITGAEAADAIMRRAGIRDVGIEEIPGTLSDHYDPSRKVLALSSDNYHGTSLAALGVAAHEAGHALQHKVGYKPLRARMALVPVTMFSSQVLPFVILGGFLFAAGGSLIGRWMIDVGIICYLVLTAFHLITLPVEFDASRRAKVELAGLGIIDRDEAPGVVETLNAAALTYVAAFVSSLAHLVHLLLLRNSMSDDRE